MRHLPEGQSPLRLLTVTAVSVGTIVFLLSIAGCGTFKGNVLEGDLNVGVLIEGTHTGVIEPLLRESLERIVITPQPEKTFELYFGPEDSLRTFSHWQNVIMVGALDSDDPVSLRLKKMLKGDARSGVEAGKYFIFTRKDVWARGQTVVFLVGSTRAALATWIRDNGGELYRVLSEARDERMMKHLFALQEQKALEDSLREAHGWTLRIPSDYKLVTSNRSPDYIRLRRTLPDRLLTIAWRIGDADEVNVDTLIAWRDFLGRNFMDPERVNPTYFRTAQTTIAGIPAVKVVGLWETFGTLGGGPFVAYLFEHGGTLYLLDGQVFAPDRRKEYFLRQLDVILRTFEPPSR